MKEVEKLDEEHAKFYTDIGVDELKSAAKIRNLESISEFASHQVAVTNKINKKLTEDGRQLADIGSKLKDDIGKLFSVNGSGEAKTDTPKKSSNDN